MFVESLNPRRGNTLKSGLSFALLLLISLFSLQCSENPTTAPTQPLDLSAAEKVLIESDNSFGLKLFREINEAQGDSNIFISPLSVAMALGMTYNGAAGSTKEAMQQTLELSGLTLEEINESYRHLIELLTQLDPKVQFDIANSIWYKQPGFPEPEVDFLQRCEEYFGALVRGLDFSAPDAAATINAWVEESTNGKIEDIVDDPINPFICMFLINAIYFKGNWAYQFDDDHTQDASFTRPDGSTITCQMMAQKAWHSYYANDDFQAVDLLYGEGAFRMTIFLPQEHIDLNGLITQFEPENMNDWLNDFSSDSVNVYIPKFTLEYDRGLNDDLTVLGMGIAFDPWQADFTEMNQAGGVFISAVKHKTFVEVNEDGTEAAAVTDVEMGYGSLINPVFRANRPFVFLIRENESQTILFIGKIVDPTGG